MSINGAAGHHKRFNEPFVCVLITEHGLVITRHNGKVGGVSQTMLSCGSPCATEHHAHVSNTVIDTAIKAMTEAFKLRGYVP